MIDADSLLREADALLEKHQVSEAKRLYLDVTRMYPGNPDAWLMLGLIEQEQANLARAEAHLRRAVELDSEFSVAHLNLANLLRLQERQEEAKYHARQAALADEEYAEAWILLGGMELESQEFESAEQSFKKAHEIWPHKPSLHTNIGHCQLARDRIQDAEQSFRQAILLGGNAADDYLTLARTNMKSGHFSEAVRNATFALDKAPTRVDIRHLLANALIAEGRAEDALPILDELVNTQTASADIFHSYGAACHALKDIERAHGWYERACNVHTGSARFHASLGHAEFLLGHYDRAMEECRHALILQPQLDEVNLLLADVLNMTGGFVEAINIYRVFLENHPGNCDAYAGLLETHEKTGDIEAGQILLDGIPEKQFCEFPRLGLAVSKIYVQIGKRDEAIRLLSDILDAHYAQIKDIPFNLLISIHNQLGKFLDHAERYQEAFLQFSASNKLRKSTFDVSEHISMIHRIIENWRIGDISAAPGPSKMSSQPLFIVGMPRSGSTLAEQILSSHPLVAAGGELQIMPQIASHLSGGVTDIPFASPQCKHLTQQQIDNSINLYLEVLRKIDSNARYVTDKLPYNYLHLGLISVLFPNAKIIHCVRAPLDTCLSIYMQNFSGPKGFAADLENIGVVYVQYQHLMKHWKSTITNPVFELSYEALVNNQAQITNSLLEFCELPWDERCLAFHTNERTALTASYNQIRQPMYRRSIGRWHNYESQLIPLSRVLNSGPWPSPY